MRPHIFVRAARILWLAVAGGAIWAAGAEGILKTENFDRDPGWEAFNNQLAPKKVVTVKQDFGFSPASNFAGQAPGEMGGQVWRTTTPAWYALRIAPKTLNDPLRASGAFTITQPGSAAGIFFGWFDGTQPPSGGRPRGSLGLNLNCEKAGGQLAVRMISASNKSCGTFITPFTPGPTHGLYTPLKRNVRFTWTLTYDPAAHEGNGRFQFTIQSGRERREEFEGKTFSVEVPEELRKAGATFDHFGLVNGQKGGGPMSIYFDDLEVDGHREDFARDPNWDACGNRVAFQDPEPAGACHFGFSPTTARAGGQPGEIGGAFWRLERNFGHYADRVGPFTLADRLEARGKIVLEIGAPDSAACFGWFCRETANGAAAADRANFVGVSLTGPTRVGHWFQPICATAKGTYRHLGNGPVIVPSKRYEWSLVYDPQANEGHGSVQVTLGGESMTLKLKPGDKKEGACFDRFGILSTRPGGGLVKMWLDDLQYTASRAAK